MARKLSVKGLKIGQLKIITLRKRSECMGYEKKRMCKNHAVKNLKVSNNDFKIAVHEHATASESIVLYPVVHKNQNANLINILRGRKLINVYYRYNLANIALAITGKFIRCMHSHNLNYSNLELIPLNL